MGKIWLGGKWLETIDNGDGTESLATKSSVDYEDKVLLFKFMTKENDGVTVDAIEDYSDAGEGKTAFIIKPKAGEIYRIARLIVSYKDSGSFDSGGYGNGISLINGVEGWFRKDGVDLIPAFDPQFPIKKNPDWATICYDTRVDSYGSGEEQLSARFTFLKTGKYMELVGDNGDEFVLYFNDDFTGLNSQKLIVQGYYQVGPII